MTDESRLTETVVSKEVIYPGRIINVQRWDVRLPNGAEGMREIVLHNGASAVIAVDDERRITLVRQHRLPIGRLTWEIPAGKLDSPAEDPLHCARRELAEETGMSADKWTKLVSMDSTPGFCSEIINIYLAQGLHAGECHPDEDEFVDVKTVPLAEAAEAVMRGEICDSKTALAILMADRMIPASTI